MVLALYVYDILMASYSTNMLQKERIQLSKKFDAVDEGEAYYILGISIKRKSISTFNRNDIFKSANVY